MQRDAHTAHDAPADEPGLAAAVGFQRDLYLYWRLIAQVGGAPLTARQQVARPLLRRLRARLSLGAPRAFAAPPASVGGARHPSAPALDLADPGEGEDPRLFFIRRLLERLSLLRVVEGAANRAADGSAERASGLPMALGGADARAVPGARQPASMRLIAAPPALMARYLAHPLAERLRLCARLWATGGWWPDHPDAQSIPPRLLAPAPPRVVVARRRLLATLADHEPGAPLPDTPTHPPGAQRPGGQRGSGPRQRRLSTPLRAHSPRHSATHPQPGPNNDELTWAALDGPLRWLGFVTDESRPDDLPGDDATDAPARASAGGLRMGLAALALRREFWLGDETRGQARGATPGEEYNDALATEDARLVERHGRVVAQSNLSLIAYPPLTAPELLALDTCASEVALDQTARYQLTREALATARASGWGAAEVAGRLAALAGAPLPANVRVTLDDWERHVARASLTPDVTLLEVRDPATIDALLGDPAARGWVARRLTPTAALLVAESAPQARAWLLRRGRLPAVIRLTPTGR